MQELVNQAVVRLGVSEDAVTRALQSLLGLLGEQTEQPAVTQLLDALPGAAALLRRFAAIEELQSGKPGGPLQTFSAMQDSGLNEDQLGVLGGMFIGFAQEKAGPELVDEVLEQVPALNVVLKLIRYDSPTSTKSTNN